ncbi:MAG: DoxX family protein, partial [Alistipes sp.]|nr:DoxX family protein [Alistipes sp.]
GLWVRFAAFLMALGMFLSIFVVVPTAGMTAGTLQFIYMGIYIFFVIAGGGAYALDSVLWSRRAVN